MCEEFAPHTGHADGMTEVECKYMKEMQYVDS